MSEGSGKNFWNSGPIAARLYSGGKDRVMVRENGTTKPLNPQIGSDHDEEGGFSWGSTSPAGKRLAMALLKDALEDDKRAAELADRFNARVISILPERWTMTRERILSYTEMMGREKITESLLDANAPTKTKRT
jgi:hypothetical protein